MIVLVQHPDGTPAFWVEKARYLDADGDQGAVASDHNLFEAACSWTDDHTVDGSEGWLILVEAS